MRFLYLLSGIGAIAGGVILAMTFLAAKSAPQEAAGAALAIGVAVLPYVLARSFEKIGR